MKEFSDNQPIDKEKLDAVKEAERILSVCKLLGDITIDEKKITKPKIHGQIPNRPPLRLDPFEKYIPPTE